MKKQSAGILMYRDLNGFAEVFLVHPGGPFYVKKDDGAWSIPKGEIDEGEDTMEAAVREFKEETGVVVSGSFILLKPVKQKSGKVVHAWALKGDLDASKVISNNFTLEWPPQSGKMKEFPEIDRAGWFTLDEAKIKLHTYMLPFIEQLEQLLG